MDAGPPGDIDRRAPPRTDIWVLCSHPSHLLLRIDTASFRLLSPVRLRPREVQEVRTHFNRSYNPSLEGMTFYPPQPTTFLRVTRDISSASKRFFSGGPSIATCRPGVLHHAPELSRPAWKLN